MSISEEIAMAAALPAGLVSGERSISGQAESTQSSQRILKVGLVGFGRTGREVSAVLMADCDMSLEWVVKRSDRSDDRSVGEVLGVSSSDP